MISVIIKSRKVNIIFSQKLDHIKDLYINTKAMEKENEINNIYNCTL